MTVGRRWAVFAVCASSVLMVGLDQSIVAIALPAIGADLGAGTVLEEWVVDAYVTAAFALLITAGVLADRFGRRRVFQVGLAVFGLGSLLCASAPSIELLVAARAVQGCGAAALVPVGLAIVAAVATDVRERSHLVGAWGAAFGISLAAGPLLGGLLLESAGWRSLFWINVPVAAAAIPLCVLLVPETRAPTPRPLDPAGQALLTIVLGSVVVAVIEGPSGPAGLAVAAVALACAGLAAIVSVRLSRRATQPMLPPDLFRRAPFVAALVGATAVFALLALTLVSGSLVLQQDSGRTPLEAALDLLPVAVAAAALAPVSGMLVARSGPRLPLLLASASAAVGGLLLAWGSASDVEAVALAGYVGIGAGFGLSNAPITSIALAGLPASQTGVAASMAATARQFGAALGAAAGGLVATSPAGLALAGGLIVALGVPLALGASVSRRALVAPVVGPVS